VERRKLTVEEAKELWNTIAEHKHWGCSCMPRVVWSDDPSLEHQVKLTTGPAMVYISHHEDCVAARLLASNWN
jgi:hypothetical protein